jgi:hypothetical protein
MMKAVVRGGAAAWVVDASSGRPGVDAVVTALMLAAA